MKKYKKQIYLFLLVSLIIVMTGFAVLFYNFRKQEILQEHLIAVTDALTQVDVLSSNLLQLESDKRGYQLTGDSAFLASFDTIKKSCSRIIAALRQNSAAGTGTMELIKLDSLVQLRLANLDSGLFVFIKNGLAPAVAFMQLKNKKDTREQLSVQLAKITTGLRKKLKDNTGMINQRSSRNRTGFLILAGFYILLMFFAARRFTRAQKKVIETHARFKEAQRIAKIGSWEWDFASGKLVWSQEQYRLFGEERSSFNLTYTAYLSHLSANDQQLLRELVKDAIEGKTVFAVEHEIVRKDGTSLRVFEQGTVLFDVLKRPTGMFGTTQDISERFKTEQELRLTKTKFKAIFDNTADGIYQSTKDGKFIMANESMAAIFGYASAAELLATVTDISSQLYADPEERKTMTSLIKANGHIENHEMQMLTKSRQTIWVSANIRIIRDAAGEISYFEGTLEDITMRKKAEEEILELNRNLDQFANITAHDLQEPIRMVSGFLGLLHKKYNDVIDEQGQSYIYRAKDGADRMSILIKDLLEYSRSGNTPAKKVLVDLDTVLDLVDRDLSIAMADTGTILRIPVELPVVLGNQSALYRLFLNLISNAIKFRKKDTIPEVVLSVIGRENEWEFTVADNGIGISPEDQSKLFKAFQRLHRREEYPGTGLGLVTCKKIVENLGGKIWIKSEPGKGTTFHFTLCKVMEYETA